jgi:hypothetical protein
MTTREIPTRPRPSVVVEWVYVRTRTLVLIGGLIVGAIATGAIWWFRTEHQVDIEAQAARAITVASEAVAAAAQRAPEAEKLPAAENALTQARAEFESREFGRALKDAQEAEALAGEIGEGSGSPDRRPARIERVAGNAQIKRVGQFSWEPVSAGTAVQPGDQIRTTSGGSAEVVYSNGSRVLVSPNSLFEIREIVRDEVRREQRIAQHLEFGTIDAKVAETEGVSSNYEVTTSDASVRAKRAAEFRLSRSPETARSEVTSLAGDVVLETGGREIVVPESTVIVAERGKVIDKGHLAEPPRLISPPDQKAFVVNNEPLVCSWAVLDRATSYQLQLSERADFSELLLDQKIVGATQRAVPELGPGVYFWRVASFDARERMGRWSETRKFRLLGSDYRDLDDRTPPRLEVKEVLVVGTNAIVSGVTEPGSLVWVDGERADVSDAGKFTWVVKLREDGLNKIQLLAQDAAGNETRVLAHARVDVF